MYSFLANVHKKYVVVSAESLYVFVYETLMDSKLWDLVMGELGDQQGEPDQIYGYREVSVDTVDGPDYHTIIKDPDGLVHGLVYKIKPEGLDHLNRWESQYEPRLFLLHSGKKAYVYVLKTEAMKDYGQNTSFTSTPEELEEAKKFA